MAAQARFNIPELDFWTDYLGMRIEGVPTTSTSTSTSTTTPSGALRRDTIKFIFTYLSPSAWDTEASLELELGVAGGSEYAIDESKCSPRLGRELLRGLVGRLNEDRDLGGFLVGLRKGFGGVMKG